MIGRPTRRNRVIEPRAKARAKLLADARFSDHLLHSVHLLEFSGVGRDCGDS